MIPLDWWAVGLMSRLYLCMSGRRSINSHFAFSFLDFSEVSGLIILTLKQCTCNEDWWIDQLMQWCVHFLRWVEILLRIAEPAISCQSPVRHCSGHNSFCYHWHHWPCIMQPSWPSSFTPTLSRQARDNQQTTVPDQRNCSSKLSIILSGMHSAMHRTRTVQ